ncbi:MAG TPA: Sec-independent protein translocase protein TatB [Mycobacterium sp.]|nr:Sec-independent protein translocase protein TatB [Mycobacterium sp.]
MFANIGWGEMLVLVVVGLVILGPERLPGAIRWCTGALRQTRDYLSNTANQLRDEIGPEFDDLRAPLSELQKLRGMTPRAALTKHLFDGDDSLFTALEDPGRLARLTDPPAPPRPPSTGPPPDPAAPTPFDGDAT